MGIMLCHGTALHLPLADQSVQCVVTSPPYWGLRDYGTGVWSGGVPSCAHRSPTMRTGRNEDRPLLAGSVATNAAQLKLSARQGCGMCGAVKADQQLGLETLHDCLAWARGESPCTACFVCHLRTVFLEIRRILRNDGTVWLNLGDSYTSGGRIGHGTRQVYKQQTNRGMNGTHDPVRAPQPQGLAEKNLVGIPWRVALALQADGWTLRSEIIWHKVNPMPESVQDRPTKSHEQVFLLTKQAQYFYDAEAIADTAQGIPALSWEQRKARGEGPRRGYSTNGIGPVGAGHTRNARTVWSIPSEPYAGAHFATFPTALVARCIQAGTSQAGCCPACKAPYVRQVERCKGEVASFNGSSFTSGKTHDARAPLAAVGQGARTAAVHTTGFAPSCTCDAGAPVQSIVFDPFSGSGTVPLVARQLGRHGVGLDLSWSYLQLARERLGLTALARWYTDGTAPPETYADLPLFAGGP